MTSVIHDDRTKVEALLNAGANPNYVTVRLQYYNQELQFKLGNSFWEYLFYFSPSKGTY